MAHSQQILIQTEQITPRLTYVSKHIFENLLGIIPVFTTNKEEYQSATMPKINYSRENFQSGLHIVPIGLLDQTGIDFNLVPNVSYLNSNPIIFRSPQPDSLGFDLFSAVFFMLSRYEEYLYPKFDVHGRFLPEKSIWSTHNLVTEPVVDEWINILKNKLSKEYPGLTFKKHQYTYIPTIDVDMPYAYRYKKAFYTIAGILKQAYKSDWRSVTNRLKVLFLNKDDPYDTYGYLNTVLINKSYTPIYFYLCGGKKPFDPIAGYRSLAIKKAVCCNAPFALSGIHNSYHTLENPHLIDKELKKLQQFANETIIRSRFHYIRFQVPSSYRYLIQSGIKEDYSMGYPTINGFRAGTSHPFYFYDLEDDKITNLKVYPFQAMDATFIYYLKYTPIQVIDELTKIKEKVKLHNGTMIIIWHNNTFEPTPEGLQWRKIFESVLD
ncbi:MAG: hypothetical protein N2662_06570 [Bacteroidales bacterium]|nr:hypothetical protein [Bacteroidales bacterium]